MRQTLESVSSQSEKDWECIIIDNGSSDDTNKIATNFSLIDKRFIVLKMNQSGVSAARNEGLKIAQGEFIQFLDSDDLIETDKLKSQSEFLRKNNNIDIICSGFMHFTDEIPHEFINELPSQDQAALNGKGLFSHLLKRNFIRINMPLLRKSVIDRVGMFRTDLYSVEDWEFWMRCAANRINFAFVSNQNSNAFVRINPDGLSKNTRQMRMNYLPAMQSVFEVKGLTVSERISILSRYSYLMTLYLFTGNSVIHFQRGGSRVFIPCVVLFAMILSPLFIPLIFIQKLR